MLPKPTSAINVNDALKVLLNYQQIMQSTMFLSSHFSQQPNETQEGLYKKDNNFIS